ncbi:hypothetical protein [Flavobacterium sp. CAU 1735]|uniref:hypothetical protein n=1 Tax=Flavobacterium sp. CAU 1735 TaxID=3140361 RepID=UPI0032615AE4
MKLRLIKIFTIVSGSLLLHSCSYGTHIHETFTPLTETIEACATPPEQVDLFFEGEKIDFDYVKIGLIQVEGAIDTSQEELIIKLKKGAQSKCADAIIGIKKVYQTREKGLLFTDVKPEAYSSEVFYGVAVRKR